MDRVSYFFLIFLLSTREERIVVMYTYHDIHREIQQNEYEIYVYELELNDTVCLIDTSDIVSKIIKREAKVKELKKMRNML